MGLNVNDENDRNYMVATLHAIMTSGMAFILMGGLGMLVCTASAWPIGSQCVPVNESVMKLLTTSGFNITSTAFSVVSGVTAFIISVKGKFN